MRIHPLKRYRTRAGKTLEEIAVAADTSKATLSRIENWEMNPSLDLIGRLKRASGGALRADDFLPAG